MRLVTSVDAVRDYSVTLYLGIKFTIYSFIHVLVRQKAKQFCAGLSQYIYEIHKLLLFGET